MKKILLYVFLAFGLLQLIPSSREVPANYQKDSFFVAHPAPKHVIESIKNACYDCHSYQTQYPWYAQIAPISFTIDSHVTEGRKRLNFDNLQALNPDQQRHAIAQSIKSINDFSMPMPSYISRHPEANLTKAQREALLDYFEGINQK